MIKEAFFLIVIAISAIIFVSYTTGAMAALDDNVNVTGTDYEESYNVSQDTAKLGTTTLGFIPYLLIIGAAFVILIYIAMKVRL